jgi:hypothetical protein
MKYEHTKDTVHFLEEKAHLEARGLAGWELVSVVGPENEFYRFYFKRELPEEDKDKYVRIRISEGSRLEPPTIDF